MEEKDIKKDITQEAEKAIKKEDKKSNNQTLKTSSKKPKKSEKEIFLAIEKELTTEIKDLRNQLVEAENKRLVAHADLDNTRKRLIKDKENAIKFANSTLVEELLVPIDNLNRAIVSAESTQDAKTLIEGVNMVQKQLLSTLAKYGLTEINSIGQEFDPQFHEACMMTEDDSVEVETVVEEFNKGYKLHDRVLRPAKVKVVKPKV